MPLKCQEKRYNGDECGRSLYDRTHCIFHSFDPSKADLFKKEFLKEFERQKNENNMLEDFNVFDFSGFIFPNEFSLKQVKFEKPVYFLRARFHGIDFSEAEFNGNFVCFGDATFTGNKADFTKARFNGEAHFGKGMTLQYAVRMASEVQFSSAIFESDILDFSHAIFNKDVYFVEMVFRSKEIVFRKTKFLSFVTFSYDLPRFFYDRYPPDYDWKGTEFFGEKTDFSGAIFSKNVEFNFAKFYSKLISFNKAEFFGDDTNFGTVTFKGEFTDFRNTKFHGKNVSFDGAEFKSQKTDFSDAKFEGKKISIQKSFYESTSGLFEAMKRKSMITGKTKYLADNFTIKLGKKMEIDYPGIADKAREDWHLNNLKLEHPLLYSFLNLFTGLGKKPFRWIAWSFMFAFVFGAIYADYPCPKILKWVDQGNWLEKINPIFVVNQPNVDSVRNSVDLKRDKNWFTPYYFSIVTFTTLGFGDIVPTNVWGEIFLTIEVIIGYIMLGLLVHILALRLTARK